MNVVATPPYEGHSARFAIRKHHVCTKLLSYQHTKEQNHTALVRKTRESET